MSKRSDLLKTVIKKNAAEKSTFGTDPRDPWSTKAGISEDAVLNKFLKSRGINPLYVSKDQKVAHSKMGEFKKWKQDHMFEQTTEPSPTMKRLKELKKSQKHQTPIVKGVTEAVDKKDTVTFDIPLLIRVLELAREDIKSDMDLHRVVERLINMRDKGMLTMDDYDTIAAIKEEYKEVLETYYGPRGDKLIAVSHAAYGAGDKEKSKRAHTLAMKAGERYRSNPVNRDKAISHIMSGANKDYTSGKRYTGDSVEIDGTPIQEGSAALRLAQALRKEREARELKDKSREAAERNEKKPAKLDNVFGITGQALKRENTMDSLAATGAPNDCANSPDDVAPKDKNKRLIQMSKSARIIKNLYKQKGMKEEVLDETWKYHQYDSKEKASAARDAHHSWRDDKGMASGNPARLMPGNKVAYKGEFKGPKPMKEETFDSEKEDKSIATYGKKPKVSDNTKKIEAVGGKPQAAAIMTGGTTLTGTPRDTVEIDPMMKLKPGLIGQTKK